MFYIGNFRINEGKHQLGKKRECRAPAVNPAWSRLWEPQGKGHRNVFLGMQLQREPSRQRQNQVCTLKGVWANFCLRAQEEPAGGRTEWSGDRVSGTLCCFSTAEGVGLAVSRAGSKSCSEKKGVPCDREGDFPFPFLYEDHFLLFPLGSCQVCFTFASEEDGLGCPRKLGSELCLCQHRGLGALCLSLRK